MQVWHRAGIMPQEPPWDPWGRVMFGGKMPWINDGYIHHPLSPWIFRDIKISLVLQNTF